MSWSRGNRSPCHRPKRNTPFPGSTFGKGSNDDIVQIARRVASEQFYAALPVTGGPRPRACLTA
jgi:hypothetical protein